MTAGVWLDTSEVHELGRDLRAGADEVMDKAEIIVEKTAYDIEGTSKTLAPVDLGYLKNSIGADIDGVHARIGPTAEYGEWVENGADEHPIPNAFGYGQDFGTEQDFHPGNDPQPYMGPAFDRHLPGFELAMGALGEGILR